MADQLLPGSNVSATPTMKFMKDEKQIREKNAVRVLLERATPSHFQCPVRLEEHGSVCTASRPAGLVAVQDTTTLQASHRTTLRFSRLRPAAPSLVLSQE